MLRGGGLKEGGGLGRVSHGWIFAASADGGTGQGEVRELAGVENSEYSHTRDGQSIDTMEGSEETDITSDGVMNRRHGGDKERGEESGLDGNRSPRRPNLN